MWETVVFLMNVLAFVLIGLQIRPILDPLEPAVRTRYFYVAGAVLVTVILVRIAWVMTYNVFSKLKARLVGFNPPRPMLPPTARGAFLVSWCGMRGVVTLAAALALPTGDGHDRAPGGVLAAAMDGVPGAFPYRDLIVLTAFSVVIGTLVIQGLTLRPLLKLLKLRDDDPVGREADEARERAVRSALSTLQGDDSPAAHAVRHEYKDLLARASNRAGVPTLATTAHIALRRKAVVAARAAIVEMRESREIGDDAFHRLEEELDWLEMSVGPQ